MDSSSTSEICSSTPSKSIKSLVNTPLSPFVFTPLRTDPLPQHRTRTLVASQPGNLKEFHQLPLPHKYEMLCELFNAMVSSIRLLQLKRLTASLTKLSRRIESLTDRSLTVHHLSQLKHIMPEVIVVEKIRVLDEETSCIKEELLISLNIQETEKHVKGNDGFSRLKQVFLTRIIDYAKSHPEGEDVPQGELPKLFYKPKQELEPRKNPTPVLQPTTLTSPTFKKRFSLKAITTSVSEPSLDKPLLETPVKEVTLDMANNGYSSSTIETNETPIQSALKTTNFDSLMTKDCATDLPNNPTKRRVLKFDEEVDEHVHEDSLDVLPETFLPLKENERKIIEEQDTVMSQAWTQKPLMAGVPKLLQMIQLLFQSVGHSVMTKEELIHRIISCQLDITDRGEVEEQLKLLREVAPEFITEQFSHSGDTLQRLSKFSSAELVQAKLLSA
ncbi:CDT1-like protein a, chloroplastic [Silene latifolia]|uniref:CDT1-like protein a, chloroplastic n=1 Tax=Silene latifolia TaxID=37657 RepID=UPI003D77D7C5